MLIIPPKSKVSIYNAPTDMRKSFRGLAVIANDAMRKNPVDGNLYVFVNKKRNKIKILQWDRNGFWLYYKSLAKGKFLSINFDKEKIDDCNGKSLIYILEEVSFGNDLQEPCKKNLF